ncbi:MAG TPA: DUF1648 domain-containing protein [Pirellulales bacterium]|jgi:uncharacterized membrane protein|nr:DUF1648 domain-containing protein [Pirellulales bacterium]
MKPTWRTELPQWIVIAAMFAVAAWAWPQLPERIPIHWNLKGDIDGYGSKFTGLLLLPITILVLYCVFRLVHLIDPGKENYATFTNAFTAVRMAFVFFMTGVYVFSLLSIFGYKVNMTTLVCLDTGALFLVIGNFMSKIRPNWFVGVRTPWTLSSKMSWNKTHRLAGWLFVLMGLSVAALGVVQTTWMFICMLVVVVGCLAWMTIYSYLVYRQDPDRTSPAGVSPETIVLPEASEESRVDKFT